MRYHCNASGCAVTIHDVNAYVKNLEHAFSFRGLDIQMSLCKTLGRAADFV